MFKCLDLDCLIECEGGDEENILYVFGVQVGVYGGSVEK